MARLPKAQLLGMVERALLDNGWSHLCLSPSAEHPARYSVFRGEQSFVVRAHIWNLTPGGTNRPLDEWRIQATGVERFKAEANGKTLILGWEKERAVFVGFDWRKHLDPIGSSPSIQLRERALDDAVVHGFAIHNKGNGWGSGGRTPPLRDLGHETRTAGDQLSQPGIDGVWPQLRHVRRPAGPVGRCPHPAGGAS